LFLLFTHFTFICAGLALANVKINFSHTLASPCTVEELATAEKVGFSSVRHRELSNNVSIAHTSSVFGSGFMNNQLSSSYVEEGIKFCYKY
jgi:hypothetical protein